LSSTAHKATPIASGAPEVSIIIPAYNTATLIAACLESVIAQTYRNFEAIVVNDGSPDTVELEKALEPYRDRIVYIRQENKKASGARNTAIRQAKGSFLAFLDSDDFWFPSHLADQMKMFQEDPTLDLVYADSLVGDSKNQYRFMERCPSEGEANFSSLVVERCQIPVSTVVARREAIVRAGLFDETLSCFDDYDMWLRTAFFGGKLGYSRSINARLSGKRPGSLSQSLTRMADAYCLILDKALRTLPLSDAQRTILTHRLAESKAMFQLEEAKRQLQHGEFEKAKTLFREANRFLSRRDLDFVIFTLGIAPAAVYKLLSLRNRMLFGQTNS
jgi:glycosyltransferase involved in cell wall biosynthesis